MFTIQVQTKDFIKDYCKKELKSFANGKIKKTKEGFDIKFKSEEDFIKCIENIFYFSRTIERVYSDDKDLFDFDLSYKDYMINKGKEINSLVTSYLFYSLGLDKLDGYSIIDPKAELGDIIIESSLFKSIKNVKKRNEIPFTNDYSLSLPKVDKSSCKYTAIVQDDVTFKKLKENISYSNQKVKVSKFDFDMLDVKFKEEQFDFVISDISGLDEEDLKDFFYMSEFIVGTKVGVISSDKINKKLYQEFKLKLVKEEQIGGYYIYILK